jgi:hypothetical protein
MYIDVHPQLLCLVRFHFAGIECEREVAKSAKRRLRRNQKILNRGDAETRRRKG